MENRRSFIDGLIAPSDPMPRAEAPFLSFHYDPDSGGVLAKNAAGYLITRNEFEALVERVRQGYYSLGDEVIADYNAQWRFAANQVSDKPSSSLTELKAEG